MKLNAKIYHIYKNIITEILRVALFFLLLALVLFGFVNNIYPNLFITLFGLFLIFEIYFSQKISKSVPKTTVLENKDDIFNSFSLSALGVFETHKDTKSFVANLINLPSVDFIISKLDSTKKEIKMLDIDKNLVANKAFDLAKQLNGKYVTTMDLFAAYLLLTEPRTKFLFNKKILTLLLFN